MNIDIVNSILETKAIGAISDIAKELQIPDGKPIEELLDDQEKENEEKPTA